MSDVAYRDNILFHCPYDAEVQFIQSTGTQYIDLGLPRTLQQEEKIKFTLTSSYSSFLYGIVGGGNRNGAPSSKICFQNSVVTFWNGGAFVYSSTPATSGAEITVERTPSELVVNANRKQYTIQNTATNKFSFLFAMASETGHLINKPICAKVEYYTASEQGKQLRDMIPVRFTNENGESEGAMYDRVSMMLFRNAGTGAFIVGPDKQTT